MSQVKTTKMSYNQTLEMIEPTVLLTDESKILFILSFSIPLILIIILISMIFCKQPKSVSMIYSSPAEVEELIEEIVTNYDVLDLKTDNQILHNNEETN